MQKIRKSVYSVILMVALLASLSTSAMASNAADSGAVKIDINQATAAELQQLKGVGEVIAERIVAYREEAGGFKTIDEIKNVKGIGEKIFEKIKDLIDVGENQAEAAKH